MYINPTNGEYITIWKRHGDKCYIIPGKYWGLFAPKHNFALSKNINEIDIIWLNKKHIVISGLDSILVINKDPQQVLLQNYIENEHYFDSVLCDFDGKFNRYKRTTNYISISLGFNRLK